MSAIDYEPADELQAAKIVAELFSRRTPASIRGSGTRSGLGRPVQAAVVLSTARLTGITLYEPAEMVISARAGTPLSEIEELLSANGQMLPFEPIDHRELYSTDGEPTIGGIVACNASGSRRIQVGAVRDNLLGVRLVNGRGEIIKSGGRVMKNVTGLDLVRLSCGAYGSLGLLTEVTLKVLPRPEDCITLVYEGLSDALGIALLTKAMGSPFQVSGAAHLPAGVMGPAAATLIRLEGFSDSVRYRCDALRKLLAAPVRSFELSSAESAAQWLQISDAHLLVDSADRAIWRVSVKPADGPKLLNSICPIDGLKHYYDWSGGLVWVSVPAEGDALAARLRTATSALGGHATLVAGPNTIRNAIDVFEPISEAVQRLTAGIKASLDPARILNPSIMYRGI